MSGVVTELPPRVERDLEHWNADCPDWLEDAMAEHVREKQ